jgi:2-pyrone-4,6-dicarboxylate lactonase
VNDKPITWNPEPSASKVKLPAGATDAHCHVFGPIDRFPYDPNNKYQPGDAPKESLFALHDAMGIERCVIVQSGCHGFDNAVVADAIATRPGNYLGVALAPPDVSDEEILRLSGEGFVGLRFNYMAHLTPGATPDQLRALAPRLANAGWNLQLHMESSLIAELAPVLAELPVDVVIDHMGRIDAALGLEHSHFLELLRLMENPHVWVKVSGVDRASHEPAPYRDAVPFARQLVETFPDRVLWGTDWPHPNHHAGPPDDGELVNILPAIAPNDDLMRRLLVDNPDRLYQFSSRMDQP